MPLRKALINFWKYDSIAREHMCLFKGIWLTIRRFTSWSKRQRTKKCPIFVNIFEIKVLLIHHLTGLKIITKRPNRLLTHPTYTRQLLVWLTTSTRTSLALLSKYSRINKTASYWQIVRSRIRLAVLANKSFRQLVSSLLTRSQRRRIRTLVTRRPRLVKNTNDQARSLHSPKWVTRIRKWKGEFLLLCLESFLKT